MIEFVSRTREEFIQEMKDRSHEVSVEIIRNVCDALDNDADVVTVGIKLPLDNISITVNKGGYLEALKLNFNRCKDVEEYELCGIAHSWIEKIESGELELN